LPTLLQSFVNLGAERAQRLGLHRAIGLGSFGGDLEVDPQHNQSLLSAVVQVLLDPPSLAIGRGDYARARRGQLADHPEPRRGWVAREPGRECADSAVRIHRGIAERGVADRGPLCGLRGDARSLP